MPQFKKDSFAGDETENQSSVTKRARCQSWWQVSQLVTQADAGDASEDGGNPRFSRQSSRLGWRTFTGSQEKLGKSSKNRYEKSLSFGQIGGGRGEKGGGGRTKKTNSFPDISFWFVLATIYNHSTTSKTCFTRGLEYFRHITNYKDSFESGIEWSFKRYFFGKKWTNITEQN